MNDDDLEVSEEFLGMYPLSTTTANSIVAAIKNILRFQIPTAKIR